MLKAHDLLEQARTTMLARSVERDVEEERAMLPTIRLFAAMCGVELTEYQGWMFMVCLKMARAHGGKFRADDYIDMASYIALAAECAAELALKTPSPIYVNPTDIHPHLSGLSADIAINDGLTTVSGVEGDYTFDPKNPTIIKALNQ